MQNFIDLDALSTEEIKNILNLAAELKIRNKKGKTYQPLLGKHLAMLFEKPSTRTRVSFEVAINQLGGQAIILNSQNTQFGRGESMSDTAQVLSRYVDIIMMRSNSHGDIHELSNFSSVPVINGLTDQSHPCQIIADLMTFIEHKGDIENKKVAWIGDSNNVLYSWIHAACKLNFAISIACPDNYSPKSEIIQWAKENNTNIEITNDPEKAVDGADAIITDTWVSMGDEKEDSKIEEMRPYQVNSNLLNKANKEAIFMHCLPAYRGLEVSEEVIDGKQSVILDEAENRLHAQKAIILWCLDIN